MTQPSKNSPRSPAEALACCGSFGEGLDPELFKALCDPTRLALLVGLARCGRPCSVTELAGCCAVDLSVVSRHLALLERAGVLESSKEGRAVFYRVRYGHLSRLFRSLADAIDECCPTPERTTR